MICAIVSLLINLQSALQKTIIMKVTLFTFALCLVLIISAKPTGQTQDQCSCDNNGVCSLFKQYPSCQCPQGFIGDKCQIKALQITQTTIDLQITDNYTYFYYQPKEVNYYQLNIKLCLPQQSPQITSLIFLQVQRSTGKIKEQPSIYQTSPLNFYNRQKLCRTFSTHFIPIRKKLNQKFQKIIFGIALRNSDNAANSWLSFFEKDIEKNNYDEKNKTIKVLPKIELPKIQKMNISCQANLYLTQNHWGSAVILIASMTLIIASAVFIYSIRKRYNYSLSSEEILRTYNLNPEEFSHRINYQAQKNNLSHFQTLMPIQKYKQLGKKHKKAKIKHPRNHLKRRIFIHLEEQEDQKKSEENFNQNIQTGYDEQKYSFETVCTICLINFQANDRIRCTPCYHIYHSECIDNWCESNLNCPMCRHDLRFPQYYRSLYMQYLRAHLRNEAA